MDEKEFQRLVAPLRQRHVACAEAAIGAPAGLTQVYADLAREAEGAIDKVTQQYEFDKAQAAIEQRLRSDVTPMESAPIPDTVWTGALTFHCPICNAVGSVAQVPESLDEPVTYTVPSGHEDLGGGEFACPQPGEGWRPWRVSRFQDRPGGAVVQTLDGLDATSWIEYHDELIREWFDGEKALIADLYPESKKPVAKEKPKYWSVCDPMGAILVTMLIALIPVIAIAGQWTPLAGFLVGFICTAGIVRLLRN